MARVWETSLVLAETYDRKFGKKYDSNHARYKKQKASIDRAGLRLNNFGAVKIFYSALMPLFYQYTFGLSSIVCFCS